MAFWFLIILAAAGGLLAFKKTDFYRMWSIAFNVFIAIYIAVMLSPWIISMIPTGTPGVPYQIAACIIIMAVLVFGILQAITVNFITTDGEITFPKLFDSIGASVLGFLSGWFVAAFILLMLSILPFADLPSLKSLTGKGSGAKLAAKPVVALCDFVTMVSIQIPKDKNKPRKAVDHLFDPESVQDTETEEPETSLEAGNTEKNDETD